MFIWTISDLIGVVILALAILGFGAVWLLIKLDDWQRRRRKRRATNSAAS